MKRSFNVLYDGRQYVISHESGVIGQAHDPYSTDEYTVTLGNRTASYYEDGLGQARLALTEDGDEFHTIAWFDDERTRQTQLKAELLFKHHVQIDLALTRRLLEDLEHAQYQRAQAARAPHLFMHG